MEKKLRIVLFVLYLISCYSACGERDRPLNVQQPVNESPVQKKRILLIDSYHRGYDWSDGITEGILKILKGRLSDVDDSVDCSDSSVDIKIIRMDTKRNNSRQFIEKAALRTKSIIEQWNPDVVIACDDNASKHLVVPFYKDSEIPFVFCGVNWDVSEYNYPFSNVTGMVEVSLITQMLETLRKYSDGDRIGILSPGTYTERKVIDIYKSKLNIRFYREIYVDTFDQWKREYKKIQGEVDQLIVINYAGIDDFDKEEAIRYVRNNSRVPSGSLMELMSPFVHVVYSKLPDEQGEWAASAALKILSGILPSHIPLAENQKAEIFLNFELAAGNNIVFEDELIQMSSLDKQDGRYSYSEISRKDYSGRQLNILTHEVPVMGEPTILHARQFEELTGAKVNVFHVPFDRLYQEAQLGIKKGKYDIVFLASLWIADMHKFFEPVPEIMLNSEVFKDIIPHYQNLAKWGDTTYHVNIDGDRHYLQIRRDLLENEKFRDEFRGLTGRELEIPRTWKELNVISRFFNGKTLEDGSLIYGISEITDKDDLLFSQFIKRAAPYAKHPDVKDGFYFDLETMKPQINNPGFVEALTDFVESQNFYPPGGSDFGLTDVINSFSSGETLFSDSWDDAFIQAMEKRSLMSDKVIASLSPGSEKVWNRNSNSWDFFPDINYVPYYAWGWTSAVSINSDDKDMAFDYLGFFSNNENHFSDLLVGRFGVNPYRNSDINPSFWIERAGWNESIAETYVQTIKDMAYSENVVMDLRIYQGRLYMNALSTGVSRALSLRDTPQEALDEVAVRWEEITERVGRDIQREAYSHIVKFENMR